MQKLKEKAFEFFLEEFDPLLSAQPRFSAKKILEKYECLLVYAMTSNYKL